MSDEEEISLSSSDDDEQTFHKSGRTSERLSREKHKSKKKQKRHHSRKHKHKHKSSSRKQKKHKKHRSKSKTKDDNSGSDLNDVSSRLLKKSGENGIENATYPTFHHKRGVEIHHASTNNSLMESMRIVVSNEQENKNKHISLVSSDEDLLDSENSRDKLRMEARKAEEVNLDSNDYLNIDDDLNLDELMRQKAALQACLSAYLSEEDDEDEEPKQNQEKQIVSVTINEETCATKDKRSKPPKKERPIDVVTILDSDEEKNYRKEKDFRDGRKRRRASRSRSYEVGDREKRLRRDASKKIRHSPSPKRSRRKEEEERRRQQERKREIEKREVL